MSGTIWVRVNGQAEMRENVREAMKRSGMTQDGVAREAGISFHKLTAFLGKSTWFAREALEAVAKVLEIPADELIGASIFKEDSDRFKEFHHRPPGPGRNPETEETAQRAYTRGMQDALDIFAGKTNVKDEEPRKPGKPIASVDRTRALCCACGTLRTCAANRKGCEPDEGDNSRTASKRCVIRLKCETCRQSTTHAVLRIDEDRDAAELFNLIPTQGELAKRERDELIERLAGFNVDVHFHSGWKPKRDDRDAWNGEPYPLRYEYDKSKSRWRIDLDPAAPYRVQFKLLSRCWEDIALEDFDQEWDPRETATIASVGSTTWREVTDELVTDLCRFMSMERERLVLEVRHEPRE